MTTKTKLRILAINIVQHTRMVAANARYIVQCDMLPFWDWARNNPKNIDQYHFCRCPGSLHRQIISIYIIEYVRCRVRLFADYTISLSSLCRLIWRHWTTKMLVRYMMPSVCLRLRQFSQLSFIQYMGLCVFSLPNSPVMIVRMCTWSYYHHQPGSMNH